MDRQAETIGQVRHGSKSKNRSQWHNAIAEPSILKPKIPELSSSIYPLSSHRFGSCRLTVVAIATQARHRPSHCISQTTLKGRTLNHPYVCGPSLCNFAHESFRSLTFCAAGRCRFE